MNNVRPFLLILSLQAFKTLHLTQAFSLVPNRQDPTLMATFVDLRTKSNIFRIIGGKFGYI